MMKNVALGIDIVEVERIRSLVLQRGERALKKLFHPTELDYALAARPELGFQRLAARFAAKEAFRKALGKAVPFREIVVSRTEKGPRILWRGHIYPVSLAHTPGFAVAVVAVDEASPLPPPAPSDAPGA